MSAEWRAWRVAERARLRALRLTVPRAERHAATLAIAQRLDVACALLRPATLGFYWPMMGELSFVAWARERHERDGVQLALPVVVERGQPLEYWAWQPGATMAKGIWEIPIPAVRVPVVPDVVLAPLVGFTDDGYRLGYGGGYFDRTLAALHPRPVAIGVGLALGRLEGFVPQPHDIPMDFIVTEHEMRTRRGRVEVQD